MFYGISLKEKAFGNSLTSNKIMIPLLSKNKLPDKMQKISENIREILRWVHIGTIQMSNF
jgi:hypothetical protein